MAIDRIFIFENINFGGFVDLQGTVGVSYSKREAVAALSPRFGKKGGGGGKQFCSRMVARAYASVGINLVKNPDYCTPENLKESEHLTQVANACVCVTGEELAAIRALGDKTRGMREKTNGLLQMVRGINPNIESLNDIDQLLIQQPDILMVQFLRPSDHQDILTIGKRKSLFFLGGTIRY